MKIAVVTRMLRSNKLEGFGVFAHQLLSRMVKQHAEHEFLFLFDRKFDNRYIYSPQVKPFVLSPPASHPALLKFWYQYRLKWFCDRHKPDVLVSPDGGIPLSADVRTLSVIHDLNFEHFPEDLPAGVRNYYRRYREIASKATRLVTVSEFSKNDIVSTYGISPDKIDVVYNGASDQYRPLTKAEIGTQREKYADGNPYFLFVGSIHQRKNLPAMMKAFSEFSAVHPGAYFIVAGAKRWWNSQMEDAFENSAHKDRIRFIGRIAENELPGLNGGAFSLLFASKFEGFGIPIVEAMKCGVPVITSDTSSMPEVAGDAALLVNPDSVDSICDAMRKVWENETLRSNLSMKGIERASAFSWDLSADRFWKSIEKTVSH